MVESGRTLYQILGVTRFASTQQIRESYLRLARTLHPDRLADRPEAERRLAERRMREVTHAWSILGDDRARADYDRSLSTPSPPRPSAPPPKQAEVEGEEPDEVDDVELSPHEVFFLRRGPVLIALAILLGIFIGSAYAGTARTTPRPTPTTTVRCIGVQPVDPTAPAGTCP